MKHNLRAVSSELPDPPYPEDTKANGFNVEFDEQRIRGSDTWVLAKPEERPWLLMIWHECWHSVPVGSMPSDIEVFSARIGCTPEFLTAHSKILLRGWIKHTDDLLYHRYVTERVLTMKARRQKATHRMRRHRAESRDASQCVTDASPSVTYAKEQEQEQEQDIHPCISLHSRPENVRPVCSTEPPQKPEKPKSKRQHPPCPYERIRRLWIEIVVRESRSVVEPSPAADWSEARKTQIKARWCDQLPDLETWEAFFQDLTKSPWLMGRKPGRNGVFKLDLFWITKPEFYLRFVEGKYDG